MEAMPQRAGHKETIEEKVARVVPEVAREYGDLKLKLSHAHPNDRVAYTQAKSDFITRVTEVAKRYYAQAR